MSAYSSHDQGPGLGPLDFQSLVDRHYAGLYRFAMSLTHAEYEAGDLVQETFLTWAAKGHQLHDPGRVKAWLFTTLHRCFLQSQRRVVRFPHFDLTTAEAELPNVAAEQVESLEAREAVQLLAQVDAQYRAAVALFYLEDYSYAEIAAILEVPLGTVKSRIARGLAQLKALVFRAQRPHLAASERAV